MSFDINKFKSFGTEELYENEDLLDEYINELLEEFYQSPEGTAYLETGATRENWPGHLIHYGVHYLGRTLLEMDAGSVTELLLSIFPRKISVRPSDDTDEVIAELLAFWNFLHRVYRHPYATDIIRFLEKAGPNFHKAMWNPANFGLGKSFLMAGLEAGYDMSNEEELQKFVVEYNARLAAGGEIPPGERYQEIPFSGAAGSGKAKISKEKKKRQRSLAKAARKMSQKNRKKRK